MARSAKAKAKAKPTRKASAKKGSRRPTKKVKSIPDGYESAVPYICCRNAANAVDFYKRAFGAKERMRMDMPGGRIGHAEIKIGGALIMLSDEFPDFGTLSPQ